MAGLMSRFTTLFKVKANKALDRAEDPGETLDYSYQKQLEMLQNVKRGVADVVTSKKRLQLQTAKLEESIVKLDGQARQALAANREDLARTALERKTLIQGQLQGLDAQIAQLEQQQQTLIDQERRLSAKVESFRTQKEVVKAQYSAAEYCALTTSFWVRNDSTLADSRRSWSIRHCCCCSSWVIWVSMP